MRSHRFPAAPIESVISNWGSTSSSNESRTIGGAISESIGGGIISMSYATRCTATPPCSGKLSKEEHHNRQYVGVRSALAYNLTQPRFQDIRVREALTLAFDFDWMNETLDHGVYQKPNSFFHGSFLAATGLPSEAEAELLLPFKSELPARVFTEPPFEQNSVSRLERRDALLRARGLLLEAGWRFDDGWLVDADGTRFEMEFLINSRNSRRTLIPYRHQLATLGIKASIRLVDTAQFLNVRRKNKNDAVFGSITIAMPPIPVG